MSADNYFITDQNANYFLTFTVVDWIDVFPPPLVTRLVSPDGHRDAILTVFFKNFRKLVQFVQRR